MSRIDTVGLAVQSGMGTKETVMEYFVPVETSSVNANRQTLEIQETIGTRFPTGLDYGTRFFEVPMAGAPRASSFPRILSGFFGQPDSTPSGFQYIHNFDPTEANKSPEPHSIFVVRNDPVSAGEDAIVDLFFDARGNTIALNIAANDYVKMDAAWIALDLDDTQTAPMASYDTSKRFKFSQVSVAWSTNGGDDTDTIVCASAGLTYNNNLDTDEAVLGSRKLYALPEGNADCEFRFSPRQTLDTFYRYALDVDPTDLWFRMTATNTDGDVLEATLHAVQEIEAPAPVSGADVLKAIDVTARGKLDDNTGKFVEIAVTNSVATYASES